MLQQLITDNIGLWTSAETKRSTTGRGSNKKIELTGINKLRELILELAVRGLLVPQDPNDEPASVLLERIATEKADLIKVGKVKKTKVLSKITVGDQWFPLPTGWELAHLNDCYDVRDGTHDSPKAQSSGYPLVTSKNLSSGRLNLDNVKYISSEDHQKIIERSKVDLGDVLFAMIGSIGNPVIVDLDVEFSIKNVALFKKYHPETNVSAYLKTFLEIAAKKMKEESSGGVQAFVSLGKLREALIPVPPLPEQHRIVAKVDELMALCDQLEQQQIQHSDTHHTLVTTLLDSLSQATDNDQFQAIWSQLATNFDTLFTTEASIDQLKQTILQLAVMGKLVPQDPNDEPASVLLERIAAEKEALIKAGKIKKKKLLPEITDAEKPFGLPKTWKWSVFATIFEVTSSKRIHATDYVSTGIPFFRSKEIGELKNGRPISTDIFISQNKFNELKDLAGFPNKGDLMLTAVGTIGNVWICDGREFYYKDGNIAKVGSHQYIDMNYTQIFIESPLFYTQVTNTVSGTAYNALTIVKLNNLILPLPPLAEQHRIVAKVDELMALCDQLKARLNQAQTSQQHLAHAVVEQAIA